MNNFIIFLPFFLFKIYLTMNAQKERKSFTDDLEIEENK